MKESEWDRWVMKASHQSGVHDCIATGVERVFHWHLVWVRASVCVCVLVRVQNSPLLCNIVQLTPTFSLILIMTFFGWKTMFSAVLKFRCSKLDSFRFVSTTTLLLMFCRPIFVCFICFGCVFFFSGLFTLSNGFTLVCLSFLFRDYYY